MTEEQAERLTKALESIAVSLAYIAHPPFRVKHDGTVVTNDYGIPGFAQTVVSDKVYRA